MPVFSSLSSLRQINWLCSPVLLGLLTLLANPAKATTDDWDQESETALTEEDIEKEIEKEAQSAAMLNSQVAQVKTLYSDSWLRPTSAAEKGPDYLSDGSILPPMMPIVALTTGDAVTDNIKTDDIKIDDVVSDIEILNTEISNLSELDSPYRAQISVEAAEEVFIPIQYESEFQESERQEIELQKPELPETPPVEDITAELAAAQQLTWDGEYEQAIAAYNTILQNSPNSLEAKAGLAQALTWSGAADLSRPLYEEILLEIPDSIPAQIGLAQALTWQEDFQSALANYEQVLSRDPNNLEALRGRADMTAGLGNRKQAIEYYQQAIAQYPTDTKLQVGLARTYYAQGDVSGAIEILQSLPEDSPEAIALLNEIDGIQVDLDFENNNNADRINQTLEATTRFRINRSNTQQFVRLGYNTFRQNNIETVENFPIQVGIERQFNKVTLSGGGGVDLFNQLSAVPNTFVETTWAATPNFFVLGEATYGAYKFNAEALENDIRAARVKPALYWQIDNQTSLYSDFTWGTYSDGNQEQQAIASIERELGDFFLGASVFYWNYNRDLDNGYFDPDGYWYYGAEVGWDGRIVEGLSCRLSVALGAQTLDAETSNANSYKGTCAADVGKFEAILGYEYSTVIDNAGRDNSETSTITAQLKLAL